MPLLEHFYEPREGLLQNPCLKMVDITSLHGSRTFLLLRAAKAPWQSSEGEGERDSKDVDNRESDRVVFSSCELRGEQKGKDNLIAFVYLDSLRNGLDYP